MAMGRYPLEHARGLVPLSDGAGEIVTVGPEVMELSVGDRVINSFQPRRFGGRRSVNAGAEHYRSGSDGWLTELKAVSQEAVVRFPDHLSFEKAATLPCAAATAWSALTYGDPAGPGKTVLTLGTGGVSLFTVRLAKLLGANLVATTSSAATAERLRALGADHVINYKETADWGERARGIAGGRGVHRVVKVGGSGTLSQSLKAAGPEGEVALIGFLASSDPTMNYFEVFASGATPRVLAVGDRSGLLDMVNHGNVDQQGGDVAAFKTVHAVGGRMSLWFNNCPEPSPSERNAAIPAADWPSLLQRAAALMNVRAHLAPGSAREVRLIERIRSRLPYLPADRQVQSMPTAATSTQDGVRFAGADDILLGDAAALPNRAMLMSGVVARRIVLHGKHVSGIEVKPVDGGPPETLSGGAYVIAGGTIGTPQLLFASGIVNPALGAYMMDHPMIATRLQLKADILSDMPDDDPSFSVWVPHSDNRPWHTQLSRTPYLVDIPGVQTRLTGDLINFAGSAPRPENRLVFDDTRLDGFGLPTYESRFDLDEDDWDIVSDMLRDHLALFRQIGVHAKGWTPLLGPWGSSLHLMGTYRMAARDDGTSVANDNSRVWNCSNLYVGGNGLFSERNSCNPTLQTVAMALRSADRIIGRLATPEPHAERAFGARVPQTAA